MKNEVMGEPGYRRDLGGGLILRWSTSADVEAIGSLYSQVFRPEKDSPPNSTVIEWTRDLMSGRHPLIGPGDFALVEDTERGAVVAATCLMNQVWEYDGVAFPVGRPEVVATEEDRRERGLIRAIFELIHARSAARGHLAQGITGIPYYYRQFGYEYAVDLGGGRIMFFAAIPKLKDGEPEPYAVREATADDLPRVLELYERERARGPVSTQVDETYWRWVLSGQRRESGEGWRTLLIADGAGRSVGYVLLTRKRWGDSIGVVGLSVEPGVPLAGVLPTVLRALHALAPTIPAFRPNEPEPVKINFALGASHPAYDALSDRQAASDPPYAWYVRVPDLPQFIRHIAPALERRLTESPMAGYTGELRLDFYRGGLRLAFKRGRLADAQEWSSRAVRWGPKQTAGFPPLVFLQLLFGRRSLEDLRYAFPDVWAEGDTRLLIEALFPARPSWVLPLD